MLKGGELFSILYIDTSMLLGAVELIERLCQTQAYTNVCAGCAYFFLDRRKL